jgi:hypothetical protein
MDQQLQDFWNNYIALAGFRNVDPETPIKFSVQPDPANANKTFIVVVSYNEPTFSQIPYNVIWIPADSEAQDYGKVLKRSSHEDAAPYVNTWEEITVYDDLWTPDQYYLSVVEDPRLHGLTTSSESLGPASTSTFGLVRLSAEEVDSRVVGANDPRNSDPRYPNFHTHPDYPRTMVKINETDYALVNTSAPPQQGMMLFIVGQSDTNPNEYIAVWKFPTQDDLVTVDRSLVSIEISGPTTVPEQTPSIYVVTAEYADGSTRVITPDSFTTSNALTSIDVSGNFNSQNITDTETTTLTAEYTEDGITVSDDHDVTITTGLELVSLAIIGPTEVDENTQQQYVVEATFSDNSTTQVLADNITSSATGYATIAPNALLTALEVNGGDKQTTLTAEYTFDGVRQTATLDVTILDLDPLLVSLEILGPTVLAEGDTATYTFRLTYDDASTVENAVPDAFIQDSNLYSTLVGYDLTANTVSQDRTVTLEASYTEFGTTVSDTHVVTIANNPPAPVSAQIIGPSDVNENTTGNYLVRVTMDDASTQDYMTATWSTTSGGIHGTINSTGNFSANEVTQDEPVTLRAQLTVQGVDFDETLGITVIDVPPVPVSAAIIGPATMNEQTTETYIMRVTYDDASTVDFTTEPTWTVVSGGTHGSIDGSGNLTANDITADQSVTIRAEHTVDGILFDPTLPVTIVADPPVPVSAQIIGAAAVPENTSSNYLLRVTYDDASTRDYTNGTWSLETGATHGSITGTGVFSANEVTQDEPVTIRVNQTIDGVAFDETLLITVEDVPVVPVSAEVIGANSIPEQTSSNYVLRVTYSDASTQDFDTDATWSLAAGAAYASIDGAGELTGNDIAQNRSVTVRAQHTVDGVAFDETLAVTLVADPPVPVSATIVGSENVNEQTQSDYILRVQYDNGSSADFTGAATWSITAGGTHASINTNGRLNANEVTQDEAVTIRAQHTVDGVAFDETLAITVVDIPLVPQTAEIIGAPSLEESTSGNYVLRVTFNDASTQDYSTDANWSVVSGGAHGSIDTNGLLTANAITADQTVRIRAQHTVNGVAFDENLDVLITNNPPVPVSATIVGATSMNEQTSENYILRVTYDDASTQDFTTDANWTLSAGGSFGSINTNGRLTANNVNQNEQVTVRAQHTVQGVAFDETQNVQIVAGDPIPVSAQIFGATDIDEQVLNNYFLRVTYDDSSTTDHTTDATWSLPVGSQYGSINSSGGFTSNDITQDRNVTIRAAITIDGVDLQDDHPIIVRAAAPVPVSAQIIGAASVPEQTSSNYILRVTYDDSSTQDFTGAATWSMASGATFASINGSGTLTANDVSSNQSVTIRAQHTVDGVAFNETRAITITAAAAVPVSLALSSAQSSYGEGSTATINYLVTYSDSTTANVKASPGLSVAFIGNAQGSSFTGGNSNDVLLGNVSGNQNVTIRGTYTEGGTTVNGDLTLTITDGDVSPRWGIAPRQEFQADYATPAFYNLLTNPLSGPPNEDINTPVAQDFDNMVYLLYPKAWGFLYTYNNTLNQAGSFDGGRATTGDGTFGSPSEITINGSQYYVYRNTFPSFSAPYNWTITYGSSNEASNQP